jgi:dUTPase
MYVDVYNGSSLGFLYGLCFALFRLKVLYQNYTIRIIPSGLYHQDYTIRIIPSGLYHQDYRSGLYHQMVNFKTRYFVHRGMKTLQFMFGRKILHFERHKLIYSIGEAKFSASVVTKTGFE